MFALIYSLFSIKVIIKGNIMKNYGILLITLCSLVACGTATVTEQSESIKMDVEIEEVAEAQEKQARYGFSYLNSVKVVSDFRLKSWQALDKKSLIIRGVDDKSYVLTLSKVDVDIQKSQHLLIGTKNTLATSRLQSGASMVRINTNLSRRGSVNGIFELATAEQEERVKLQVVGENYADTISPEHKTKAKSED